MPPIATLPVEDQVGTVLSGRYQLLKLLGEGGMGRVYRAEHIKLGRTVAIKVLADDRAMPRAADRFIREAKATAAIGHPNIVDVLDFGETPGGSLYIVMEHLEGEDLGATLEREGAQPWPRVRDLVVQICHGLQAAHDEGIVHRDMKPENCFLTKVGRKQDFIKLLDFGIAKLTGRGERRLTGTGGLMGTPEYMSPEQARGSEADHRADVYAVGIIMYELLTGDVPFTGDNFMGVLLQHVNDPIAPPSVARPDLAIPPALDAIVLRALAKDREQRYGSMAEMAEALTTAHLETRTLRPTPEFAFEPAPLAPVEEPAGRATGVVALIGLVLIALIGTGTVAWVATVTPQAETISAPSKGLAQLSLPAAVGTVPRGEPQAPQTQPPTPMESPIESPRAGPELTVDPAARPTTAQVSTAMRGVMPLAKACVGLATGTTGPQTVRVRLTVRRDGTIAKAVAKGNAAGSSLGSCVANAAKRAALAKYEGERAVVGHTFRL